jgi:hypothetical protein
MKKVLVLKAGAKMNITASPNWWRVTAIIVTSSPLWVKAYGYTLYAESFLLPILLVGAAALAWFAWSGLAVAWLAISSWRFSRGLSEPAPRHRIAAVR